MRNRKKIFCFGLILLFVPIAILVPGCGAQHSVATYTVTYNANGATSGDVPADSTYYQSDLSVTVLGNTGNLCKEGYVFAGWSTNSSGTGTTYSSGQKFSIKSANAVLYACWADRTTTFTVTYNANGATNGSVPTDSNSYKAGHVVTTLGNTGNLEKTGYKFAGWNTKSDGTGVVYTQEDFFAMGLANVILYANWSSHATYTVTYNSNGATSGTAPTDTTNYETGYTVTVLNNTGSLDKTGYTFVGWNTQANGAGVTYTFGQEFLMGSSNITLYAKWTANPSIYTVTYNGNGHTSGNAPTDNTNYETGQTVFVLGNTGHLEKTGYSFDGWNTNSDGSGTTYLQGRTFSIGSSNVTLYAKWKTDTNYTVTYDGNGNTGGKSPTDSNTYQPGYTITVLGNTGTLEKTSFVFAGWNTKADGSGVVYTQADTFAMGFSNVTLYANWSANPTYLVTYESNGATSGSPPIDTTHYETGYSVTVLENSGNLERTGYYFVGWNTQANGAGTTYAPGQEFLMGTANVTLYSKWTQHSIFTVSYNGNGNTSGNPPVDSTKYETGQTVPVFGNTGNLEKTNYRFVGWNTNSDGSGTTYLPGQSFTMESANVSLYAKWNTAFCTVNFNSQGGSSVASQEVFYGDKAIKPADPTKENYTFAGWFKESAGTHPWFFDTDAIYSSTTLYAKWTINQYTVSFNSQGGSTVPAQTVFSGQKATRPDDPTKYGYVFDGWYKDPECTESWLFYTDVVKNNITLYGGWKKNCFTVRFDSQGGTAVESQTIEKGSHATMPSRPSKGNDALAGWYKEKDCLNQWLFYNEAVTSEVTLYAKWATYKFTDIGPAGGYVIHDKGSYSYGWRYIEAAPNGYDYHYIWGSKERTNACGTDIGTGLENTNKILSKYGTGVSYAARICHELIVGDFHDWFLPSVEELKKMRTLANWGHGTFFANYYWSSSENDDITAICQLFHSFDEPKSSDKSNECYVRAVRYF